MNTKQQTFVLFEENRAEFLKNARWFAVRLARKNGGIVDIDMVREEVGSPQTIDNRVFGAVFNTPYFEHAGFTRTRRETSHGRPISMFRLVEEKVPSEWREQKTADNGQIYLF